MSARSWNGARVTRRRRSGTRRLVRWLIGRAARPRRARKRRPGWVYVLEPELLPGWMKIGMTRRNVAHRVRELSRGLPGPLAVRMRVFVADARAVERRAHVSLRRHRDVSGGEWFQVGADEARRAVSEAAVGHEHPLLPDWALGLVVLALASAAMIAMAR